MSEPIVETSTIVNENGKTIIIAHPPVKKQIDYWELINGWYETVKNVFQHVEETPSQAQTVEVPLVVEVSPPIIIQVQKPIQQIQQKVDSEPSQMWTFLSETFSKKNISHTKKVINQKIAQLDGIDERLSRDITKFKGQNLLVLGDVRTRSILLGCSSALLYKIISVNSKGFIKRTRNMAGSFLFMGYWLVPELFNPFLRKPDLAKNIC